MTWAISAPEIIATSVARTFWILLCKVTRALARRSVPFR
jgi:hypothetical protein